MARVGELSVPVLSADLVRVARLLRASIDGTDLADRIVSGMAQNGELDLEPRSAVEKSALELALTELTWAEPHGRLLPRLRLAVAEWTFVEATATASLEHTLTEDARSTVDAHRSPRAHVKVVRSETGGPKKSRSS